MSEARDEIEELAILIYGDREGFITAPKMAQSIYTDGAKRIIKVGYRLNAGIVVPEYKQVREVTETRVLRKGSDKIVITDQNIHYNKEAEIWNQCIDEFKRLNGLEK